MRALLALLAAALPGSPGIQEEDAVSVRAVDDDFQRRWTEASQKADWAELFRLYEYGLDRLGDHLIQPDPQVRLWVPLGEHLARALSAMPDAERDRYEIAAQELLETVSERRDRLRLAGRFAFTRAGREALEAIANEDFDAGRFRDAVLGWTRVLETAYSPALVARIAHAHLAAGDAPALAGLAARAAGSGWKGDVRVAGRKRELAAWLAELHVPAVPAAAPLRVPAPLPTCQLPLGTYDFKGEGGTYGRSLGSSVAATVRANGKTLLLSTNGIKLVAIDPARVQGGTLEDAVDWKWPKEGNVRYSAPSASIGPFPSVGAAVAEGRAYVAMCSTTYRQGQIGRRYSDRFDGPAALRAFDTATGECLWDTDTLTVEVEGQSVPVLESVFGKGAPRNFSLSGPPLVRGERLYLALMTSPLTPRECHVVCLDARSGKPVWKTWIATAPPTKESGSVPSIAEEDGTVAVVTSAGVAAALDSETGATRWLVKYPRTQAYRYFASAPVLHRSAVYALAGDAGELLAFDRATGRPAPPPAPAEELAWTSVQHLVGRSGDWLVLGGRKNYVYRVTDGRLIELEDADAKTGRPVLAGGYLYLPVSGAIHLYDTATWRVRESVPWAARSDAPNLLVTDGFLAAAGDRLDLSTSSGALLERLVPAAGGATPRPEACRRVASILENAGRPAESVPWYRKALAAWDKDPAWAETAEGLRKKLADLKEKLGAEFPPE